MVEDEPVVHKVFLHALGEMGFEVLVAESSSEGLRLAVENDIDVALLDIHLPDFDGIELLRRMRNDGLVDFPVVMVTGYGSVESAVAAMKLGASDYVQKPLKMAELERVVAETMRGRKAAEEGSPGLEEASGLIGDSPAMKGVLELVRRVAFSDVTVVIYGESGTGKELVARAIHTIGPRADEPFIPVDCSTMATSIVESELFGHVRGAFTGAEKSRDGLLRLAGRGTAFLDEIFDLPMSAQAKLLRALQENTVRPVGSGEFQRIEARVVAASNRDLLTAVRDGQFREDLFYRLHVIPIHVPPLRDRSDDIPALADHFVKKHSVAERPAQRVSSDAKSALQCFEWPGNVRELENVIRRAIVMCDDEEIGVENLPNSVVKAFRSARTTEAATRGLMAEAEVEAILSALAKTNGNKAKAAELLGLGRSTIYARMRKYGLMS